MTENNAAPAAEQETTNALTDEQAMDKFQGFSTRDGERVDPTAEKADDKPAGKQAKGSVPSVKPNASGDDKTGQDDGETATDEGAENPKRKSAQARIDKAVGRQRAAERRADSLEQRLAAMEARLNGSAPAQQTTQQSKAKEAAPDPADYEYGELDKKYINDLVDYRVAQGLKEHQSRSKQEQDNTSRTKAQQEHQQRIDEFYSKGLDIAEDFDEVVGDPEFKVSPVLGELILESEHGPAIAYAAASDPKEAKRVSAMSPQRQAAWFGTKEAELSSESSDAEEDTETGEAGNSHSATSPKTTKAPPPPKGKARGSGTAQQVSPATTDFTQFERLAMKSQE